MADLLVSIGADASQFNKGMQDVANTAKGAANDVSNSLSDAAMKTDALGGSAMTTSMRFYTMRSGVSAARDGVMAFTLGGQAAERSLLAMGHHITSLVNETGSLKGAFGALASSLWGPGGVILGITLAVELFEKYSESQKKAAETQDGFTTAINDGVKSSSDELSHLMILYQASQNDALSRQDRLTAVKELQKEYPAYFGNLTQEAILAGKAAGAYDRLTQSILNSAVIKAGQEQLAEQLKPLIALTASLQAAQQEADARFANRKPITQNMNNNNVQNTVGSGFRPFNPNLVQVHPVITSDNFSPDRDSANLDDYKKKLQDKIKATGLAIQQTIEEYGISGLLKKEEVKGGKADTDTIFDKLQKRVEDLKDQLASAFLANSSPTVIDKLASELATASTKLDKVKEQLKDYLSISRESIFLESANPTGSFKKNPKAIGGTQIKGVSIEDTGFPDADTSGVVSGMQAEIQAFQKRNNLVVLSAEQQKAYNEQLADMKKIGEDVIHVFGTGLTNAFESALNGTQNLLTSLGKFLEELITKLLAAAAAAAVLAGLLALTGLGPAIGLTSQQSSFLGLFGQLSGVGGIGKHASGGIFTQAHVGMFGEAGPEAIVTPKHLQDFAGVSGGGNQKVQIEPFMVGSSMWFKQTVRTNKSIGRVS